MPVPFAPGPGACCGCPDWILSDFFICVCTVMPSCTCDLWSKGFLWQECIWGRPDVLICQAGIHSPATKWGLRIDTVASLPYPWAPSENACHISLKFSVGWVPVVCAGNLFPLVLYWPLSSNLTSYWLEVTSAVSAYTQIFVSSLLWGSLTWDDCWLQILY